MPARTDDVNHPTGDDRPGYHLGRFDNDLFLLQDFFKNPTNDVPVAFKFFNDFDLLSINASAC